MDSFDIFNIEQTAYAFDLEHLRAIAKLQGLESSYLGGSTMFLKVRGGPVKVLRRSDQPSRPLNTIRDNSRTRKTICSPCHSLRAQQIS